MSFGNPIWLWGMTAMLIPIAIHLLSRKEGKVVRVGSVRHLVETNTARFSSIRLNELLLLALRCLLIAAVALYLADAKINVSDPLNEKWLVIEPGTEKDIPPTLLDSLTRSGYARRPLNTLRSQKTSGDSLRLNYWTLADQLSKENVEAIVFARNYQENFYGHQTSLPPNVKWIQVADPSHSIDAARIPVGRDSLWTRKQTMENGSVFYETGYSANDTQKLFTDTVDVQLVTSDEYAEDAKIIRACLETIRQIFPGKVIVEENKNRSEKNYDVTFWLSNIQPLTEMPNSFSIVDVGDAGSIILSKHDVLFRDLKINTDWIITRHLSPSVVVKEHLVTRLAEIMLKVPDQITDHTVVPEEFLWERGAKTVAKMNDSTTGTTIILVLIITLILLERWISYNRMI